MRGAVAVALALIALQVVLSTPLASTATALVLPAQWARDWMDPTIPLIKAAAPAPAAGTAPPAAAQAGLPVNMNVPPPPAPSTGLAGHVHG